MQIINGCEAELFCSFFVPLLEVYLFTVLWSYMGKQIQDTQHLKEDRSIVFSWNSQDIIYFSFFPHKKFLRPIY